MNWIILLNVFDPARAGTIGLTMFVVIFAGVTTWALTRTRRQVDQWSSLPLETTQLQHAQLPPRPEGVDQ